MYPADADWVNMHMRCEYPVLCVPREGSDEYVLSETAFCLHEGPDDGEGKASTEFHTVSIGAPRLAILMRDDYLREIVDDRDDNICLKHAQELASQLSAHHIPNEATSMFHNVLVYKPRVAYMKTEAGYVSSESSKRFQSPADLLDPPVARIENTVTQEINALVLNEAYNSRRSSVSHKLH